MWSEEETEKLASSAKCTLQKTHDDDDVMIIIRYFYTFEKGT
jgi:hypothetical protein